jgi:hypothetical protein
MLRNNGFRQFNQFNAASAKFKAGDTIMYGTASGTQWKITAVDAPANIYTIKCTKSAQPDVQPVGVTGTASITVVDAYYNLVPGGSGLNLTTILLIGGAVLLLSGR